MNVKKFNKLNKLAVTATDNILSGRNEWFDVFILDLELAIHETPEYKKTMGAYQLILVSMITAKIKKQLNWHFKNWLVT